jgi:hypothetical protein
VQSKPFEQAVEFGDFAGIAGGENDGVWH